MKIVISSDSNNLEGNVDQKFGRCKYFVIVDILDKKIKNVTYEENKGAIQGHGAGVKAAEQIGNLNPDVVITGNLGPNSTMILKKLNIKTYHASGNIMQAIDDFNNSKLDIIKEVSKSHSGLKTQNLNAVKVDKISNKGFKELLYEKLTDKEISYLKTAYDTVGDIAIIEVEKELEKKEKFIAKTLIDTNKNIKTVLKKSGIHEGEFRTQEMKFLAGIDKRETIVKENGVSLKINVEEVYYSVRMATERKRISSLVKKGEDVLVMFSGAAPYPCVISKNTSARQIVGIEINPKGHKLGVENIKLNKLKNVFLINGDVKQVIPNYYNNILGLKTANIKGQLNSRLKHDLKIFEIHTFNSDFLDEKKFLSLKRLIEKILERNMELFIHQPIDRNKTFDLSRQDITNPIYKKMIELVEKYDVNLVLHPEVYYGNKRLINSYSTEKLIKNIISFRKFYSNIYIENGIDAFFDINEIIDVIKKTGIKNFCIDLSHFKIRFTNEKIKKNIELIQKKCNTYFHVNDSDGINDSLILNEKSNIDLDMLLPYVNKGIVEIKSKNENKGDEMISSFRHVNKFSKKFDRIIMPLPKSAEDFLDTVLSVSKKGSVIHFYDFLNEIDFEKAYQKVEDACFRNSFDYEVLDFVKCGQHAPHVFRVCLDFKIK